jgi:hypothetical protein
MIHGRNAFAIAAWLTLFSLLSPLGIRVLPAQQAPADGEEATKPEGPPFGGKYDVLPVLEILLEDSQEGKRALQSGETKIAAIVRGSEPLQPNLRAVQIYYGQYFFPRLTHPKYLNLWAESRQKFLQQQLGMRTTPRDVHQYLVDLARQMMTTIIRGNYHPAARTNAMLLLGSLNAEEAVLVGENRRPPMPLTAALGVMFQELDNPQQSDGVRAAALAGILRHVWVDNQWPPASRQLSGSTPSQKNREKLIVTAMLKWVNAKEPPEGRSQTGHDWLRRRAIEVLGLLGTPGDGNAVVTSLDGLLLDQDQSVAVRCTAAEALGKLNLPQGAMDAKEMARNIATVAVFACRKEIARVEEQLAKDQEAKASAAGSMYGGSGGYGYGSGDSYGGDYEEDYGSSYDEEGGYGSMMGGYGMTAAAKFNPLGYRIDLTRRRIKHQLLQAKRGLIGPGKPGTENQGVLARAADGDPKTYVNKAVKGIDDIIAIIDANEETEMEPLVEKLTSSVQVMENACEIVVTLPGEEGDPMLDEGLLNPLELPEGVPGPDDMLGPPVGGPDDAVPAKPAAPPAGAPQAPPEEPVLGEPPAGGPPAGGGPAAGPPAGNPGAAKPAAGAPAGGPGPAGGNPAAPPKPAAPAPGGAPAP